MAKTGLSKIQCWFTVLVFSTAAAATGLATEMTPLTKTPTRIDAKGDFVSADEPRMLLNALPPMPSRTRHRLYLLRHGTTDWNLQGRIQGGGYDIELNEVGRRQAAWCALQFVSDHCRNNDDDQEEQEDSTSTDGMKIPFTLDVVASSPLVRAKETGDIIYEAMMKQQSRQREESQPPPQRIISSNFAEMSFGDFEGLIIRGKGSDSNPKVQQYLDFRERMQQDKGLPWPNGGESNGEVEQRGVKGLNEIFEKNPGCKHIMIVAHGRFNKILIPALLSRSERNIPTEDTLITTTLGQVVDLRKLSQGNTCINVLDVDDEGNWTPHVLDFVSHLKNDPRNHGPT